MEKGKISRFALHPAFGFVGNFYDAKSDAFIKEVQLERFKHLEIIELKENERSYPVEIDEFHDRFKWLNVDMEQKFSILSNLAETKSNGFAQFLTTLFEGNMVEECNEKPFGLVKIWHKASSRLNFADLTIKNPVISQKPLQNATHIVDKVIYGFAVAAVFIATNDDIKMRELKRILYSIINNSQGTLATNSLYLKYKNMLENAAKSVKVHIFADPQLIPVDISFHDTIKLLTSKCPFNCAPLPIQYEMVPITLLIKNKYFNASNFFPLRIQDLSFIEDFDSVIKLLKSIDAFYTKMADFMQKFPYCFRIDGPAHKRFIRCRKNCPERTDGILREVIYTKTLNVQSKKRVIEMEAEEDEGDMIIISADNDLNQQPSTSAAAVAAKKPRLSHFGDGNEIQNAFLN